MRKRIAVLQSRAKAKWFGVQASEDTLLERSFRDCADCGSSVYVLAAHCRECGADMELLAS